MAKTTIEWTDQNWNFLRGCSRKSPGCTNCYAESIARRFSGPGLPYEGLIGKHGKYNGNIMQVPEKLEEPLHWKKPRKVFVCSTSDLFHENVQFDYIDRAFSVMAMCPQHTFQILTKRPERMKLYFSDPDRARNINRYLPSSVNCFLPLPNVWLGVSAEDQTTTDERIPLLLQTPAAIRWVSAEPLLDGVWLNPYLSPACTLHGQLDDGECDVCAGKGIWEGCGDPQEPEIRAGLDWVVVGGESGAKARPMHPSWVRSIRDQCVEAGVPFLFKQWGEYAPNWLNDDAGNKIEGSEWMAKMGKRLAGRMLDGQLWDQYPGDC